MNVDDLIYELRNAGEVSTFVRNAAADRLSELSPSRLSANDEGVTDADYVESVQCLVVSMRERGVTGSDPWWGQDFLRVEKETAARLEALSTKPEAVKGELSDDLIDRFWPECRTASARQILKAEWAEFIARTQPPTPASGEQMEVVVGYIRPDPHDTIPEEAATQFSEKKPSGFDAGGWEPVVRKSTLEAAESRIERLEKALTVLLEPFESEPCRHDHHGYCQAHFVQSDCCVAIARAALADQGAQS